MDKDQYSYGFDAQAGEYGNLVTKGIIDPTKVVRSAIQGAASIAGLLITTEAMQPTKRRNLVWGQRSPVVTWKGSMEPKKTAGYANAPLHMGIQWS